MSGNTGRIAIIGGGAWGTALACAAVRAGLHVRQWARDAETAQQISHERRNRAYLGEIELEADIRASADLGQTLAQAETAILATPAQTIGEVGRLLADQAPVPATIIVCAKGIDQRTGRLPAQTLTAMLPQTAIAALSGPSFATDVARGLPTAVTIASDDLKLATSLAAQLSSSTFRIYASDDITGVELGGALKNVLALAVGAARGMNLGASAEAALIARGFSELVRLATGLGARPETLAGLSGLGDLVLTCSSTQSRNFTYGMALGRGDPVEGLALAEGVHSARIAAELARKANIEAPIIETVARVVGRAITAHEAVEALLSRPLKAETL